MFDEIPPLPKADATAWRDALAIGDIVIFPFPVVDAEADTVKRRPCLVIDITEWNGERFATIAYGTSADTKANRGYEVRLRRPEVLAALKLDRETRFVCARRATVSVCNPGFQPCDGTGTPVVGRLSGSEFERMNDVRARLEAEAHMAADRRRRSATDAHGRSFTVESRYPRRRATPRHDKAGRASR